MTPSTYLAVKAAQREEESQPQHLRNDCLRHEKDGEAA